MSTTEQPETQIMSPRPPKMIFFLLPQYLFFTFYAVLTFIFIPFALIIPNSLQFSILSQLFFLRFPPVNLPPFQMTPSEVPSPLRVGVIFSIYAPLCIYLDYKKCMFYLNLS